MIYVTSDLHGEYEAYRALLDRISLRPQDRLYVLGDVIDRGRDGVRILSDMASRPNVVPLTGNHEQTMLSLLLYGPRLAAKIGKDGLTSLFRLWFADGGEPTFRAWRALSEGEKRGLVRYLCDMDIVAEVTAGGGRFFLSHTLPPFDDSVPLRDRPADLFLFGRPTYTRTYLPDAVTVTGHTPTFLIDPAFRGRIWKGAGHIAVDCGVFATGVLGCICPDTAEEYYVEKG